MGEGGLRDGMRVGEASRFRRLRLRWSCLTVTLKSAREQTGLGIMKHQNKEGERQREKRKRQSVTDRL